MVLLRPLKHLYPIYQGAGAKPHIPVWDCNSWYHDLHRWYCWWFHPKAKAGEIFGTLGSTVKKT